MRLGWKIAGVLAVSGACFGGTLNDTFGQPQERCLLTYTPPYSTCDVMGNEMLYDIQKASVSFGSDAATVAIYMNTGAVPYGASSLALRSFQDEGVTLLPGDIFFYSPATGYDPDNPGTVANLLYGIPLVNHDGFAAGSLYRISGGVSTETAQVALQDGSDFYRWNETVLMTGAGTPASVGAVTVSRYGDGVVNAQYLITATVPLTAGLSGLQQDGQIGMLFSSADCGNDVLQGVVATGSPAADAGGVSRVSNVPEPGPMLLMASGLVLLVAGRLRRRRRN